MDTTNPVLEPYQLYLLLGLSLIFLEMLSPSFFLAPLGVGFLVVSLSSLYISSLPILALVFAVASASAYLLVRRWSLAQVKETASDRQFGPVGKSALLIEKCQSTLLPGKVKIFSDEFEINWTTAEQMQPLTELDVGAEVRITAISGNKVDVAKLT